MSVGVRVKGNEGRKVEWLICAFDVDADMPPAHVKRMAYEVSQKFIKDMGQQGYEFYGGQVYLDPTPRRTILPKELPSIHEMSKTDTRGNALHDPLQFLSEPVAGRVDYRMTAPFIMKDISTQREEDT